MLSGVDYQFSIIIDVFLYLGIAEEKCIGMGYQVFNGCHCKIKCKSIVIIISTMSIIDIPGKRFVEVSTSTIRTSYFTMYI